jgi:hypothetical protein
MVGLSTPSHKVLPMQGNSRVEFDWVSGLAECSVGAVFEKLKLEVKADVETRDRQLKDTPYDFRFESNHRNFSAVRHGYGDLHRSIIFSLGEPEHFSVRRWKSNV